LPVRRQPAALKMMLIDPATVTALAVRSREIPETVSSGTFLFLQANAKWRTALASGQATKINVQLSKGANKSAPMHPQHPGSFALIPINFSENGKNKLPFKFVECFEIENARPVHPQH